MKNTGGPCHKEYIGNVNIDRCVYVNGLPSNCDCTQLLCTTELCIYLMHTVLNSRSRQSSPPCWQDLMSWTVSVNTSGVRLHDIRRQLRASVLNWR